MTEISNYEPAIHTQVKMWVLENIPSKSGGVDNEHILLILDNGIC